MEDLKGKAVLELNSRVLFLSSWTGYSARVQVNICLQKPRKLSLWSARGNFLNWLCRLALVWKVRNVYSGVISCEYFFSFTSEKAVVGSALTDANKTAKALCMKASASWCTVLYVLDSWKNEILKPWKVSFLEGAAFIWQQNVLLFYAWMPIFFFFFAYRSGAKSYEPRNTSVSSENHLTVFTTFTFNSELSLQLLVLSTQGFSADSRLYRLFLALGDACYVQQLYRIVRATSVQGGGTLASTKI